MKPIYLDYAATTPVDPQVAEKMMHFLTKEGQFGNPSSNTHCYGEEATAAIENAREQMADLIGAKADEIIWTASATESNNIAIKGLARALRTQGRHIITATTEHKAVLDTCRALEAEGFEVTYLQPQKDGLILKEDLSSALREDTLLVSIMYVNNETGVIQNLAELVPVVKAHGAYFHTDAVQAIGKLPVDVKALPVDLLSVTAHKFYGPKGVGALYVRHKPKVPLVPIMHGGGHEKGLRSGTLPTHQIVAMGEACALAKEHLDNDVKRLHQLKGMLWNGLSDLPGIVQHGAPDAVICNTLNIGIAGVDGEALVMRLRDQVAVSSGSACNSAAMTPSHVLQAMQVPAHLAHRSIRLSLGRFSTEDEVHAAVGYLRETILSLRDLSPFKVE